MTEIFEVLDLTQTQVVLLLGITFAAGMIRGFSGFALSAVVMAAAALILSPVELIPMLLILEITASLFMLRQGISDADHRMALGLAAGSAVALPFGLWMTLSMPPDTSRLAALALIIVLALAQLLKIRMAFLATTPGLAIAGLTAGLATGLASVGGMIVALYVLAQDTAAAKMRASLVIFLLVSASISIVTHFLIGTMNMQVFLRGVLFTVPSTIGVLVGKAMFIPAWQKHYKPFCLCLLIVLALAGVLRLLAGV